MTTIVASNIIDHNENDINEQDNPFYEPPCTSSELYPNISPDKIDIDLINKNYTTPPAMNDIDSDSDDSVSLKKYKTPNKLLRPADRYPSCLDNFRSYTIEDFILSR